MSGKLTKKKLSTVIITKNEAVNIERCIRSVLPLCDDIIVVDSFSTDETKNICQKFKEVNFIRHEWMAYAKTKNFANQKAKHDWILSLDADEVLSERLQLSISKVADGKTCSFNRLSNYCGNWVKHGGWYPDTKVRLFNRNESYWKGDYVHETLFVPEEVNVYQLKGDCLHYTISSVDEHIERAKKYSKLAALKLKEKKRRYPLLQALGSAFWKFIQMYILKAGFLDGKTGIQIASISALSKYWRYRYLQSL